MKFDPAMVGADMMKKTPSKVDDAIARKGRKGDTVVAHLSLPEVMMLKRAGGSGSVNPKTGMLEFWDDGGNDPGGVGGDTGSTGNGASGVGGDMGGYETGPSPTDPESGRNSPTDAMMEPAATADQFGKYMGLKSRQELQDEPVGPVQQAHPTLSNFADKYGGYGKAGYYGYSVGGPIAAGLAMGLYGMYDMAKNFDADKEGPGMMEAAGKSSGSTSGGYDAMVGANDPAGTPAASPAVASLGGRLIYKQPYKFNRQMVGISAHNVYPEKR